MARWCSPLVASLLVVAVRELVVAEHDEHLTTWAVRADDECSAEAEGAEAACGFSALQMKSEKVSAAQVGLAANASARRGLGTVAAIYTYGAPATSYPAFEDLAREDRNFQGLRSYTENILAGHAGKQIDGGAIFTSNLYSHPRVATLVLHRSYHDSYYVPGKGRPDWPKSGAAVYMEWRLHHENPYYKRFDHVVVDGKDLTQQAPFPLAKLFSHFAFDAYYSREWFEKQEQHMPGWRLVAREVQNTLEALDAVWIVQEESTLHCALVFTGTSSFAELGTNAKSFATGYCGYKQVHSGYRDKLWWLTQGMWPRLRPKLGKCSSLLCAGHSLGGSLCDIFAACANSGRVQDPDFEQQQWEWEDPVLMPSI